MKVLITGGAGFIGSHVAQHCLDKGYDIVVIDDLSGGFVENLADGGQRYLGSICDQRLVAEIFSTHKFDYVYHLAAYAAEGLSHFIRPFNYWNNLTGSVNLINQAIKHEVKRFVFTSSMAVYGEGNPPFKETDPLGPEDPYGVAKWAVERDLFVAKKMFDLDYTIIRPHNVYGPNQHIWDRYRNVAGIFMNQIVQGKPLTIFGDGSQKRSFSYISDIAPHIASAPEMESTKGQTYNLGSSEVTTVKELASACCRAMGVEEDFQYWPSRYEVKNAYSDQSKSSETFGPPMVGLEEGLKYFAEWVKAVPMRPASKVMRPDIEKNLPDVWKRYL